MCGSFKLWIKKLIVELLFKQPVFYFLAIIDIGSASFKYDMRRLTEILAFPKAWYRRSIVRRMFLGDLSMSTPFSEEDDSFTSHASPNLSRSHER